jgi:hypothetical protein
MTLAPQLAELGIRITKDTNAVCVSFMRAPPELGTNGREVWF